MTNDNNISRIFHSVFACWSPMYYNFIESQLTRTHARLHVQIHALSEANVLLSVRNSIVNNGLRHFHGS